MSSALLRPSIGLLIIFSVLTAASLAAAQTPQFRRRYQPPEFVPGEVIVAFKSGVSLASRAAAIQSEAAALKRPLLLPDAVLLRLPEGRSVPAAVQALSRRPEVRYAEPNYIYRAFSSPNDPRFSELWGLHQANDADVDAPAAWDITTGSSAIIVAVVDTGVALQHPDLAPNIWVNDDAADGIDDDSNGFIDDTNGWDFIEYDNAPYDLAGHGTHVAGTIGARGNNGLGITGVNWQVSIMPLRAGDESGSFPLDAIVNAFNYACANGARVVNGSFGGSSDSISINESVLNCPGVLFVFASGNESLDLDTDNSYPCEIHEAPTSAANVICVGATTQTDGLASFSNHGTSAVHLAAPGANILSSVPAYSPLVGPDDMEDPGASFDARWSNRVYQPGNKYWDITSLAASHGSYSVTDSPGAGVQYTNDTVSTIRYMPAVDLTGRSTCRVSYDLRLDTEFGYDFFVVLAGTDTAATTELGAWTGSTGNQFFRVSDSLGGFEGQPTVYIRLGLLSDYSITGDGAYVDQFAVECINHTAAEYEFNSGTSMAAPHVTGVAALVLAQNPARTVAEVKTALLNGVDALAGLSAYTITGGRLNACKALGGTNCESAVVLKRRRGQTTSE